ncbi:MAG: hypothetical protein IKU80_05200 [Firmicutes bacterium]|nr:hypothetical protein [Bacillota bacterium]
MTDMVYLFEEDDEKIQMFFDEFDDGQREDNFSAVREDREKAYLYDDADDVYGKASSAESCAAEGGNITENNVFYGVEKGTDIYESIYPEYKNSFFDVEDRNNIRTEFLNSEVYGGDILKAEIFEGRQNARENVKNGDKNISVTVNNNVSVTKECDIDDVIERLSAKIAEAVEAAGEGMHV